MLLQLGSTWLRWTLLSYGYADYPCGANRIFTSETTARELAWDAHWQIDEGFGW